MFSWFRPVQDTAPFRLYRFAPLALGDSLVLELKTAIIHKGFTNELYARNLLDNGTFLMGTAGAWGMVDDDELQSSYQRKEAGLAPKVEDEIAQDDPVGRNKSKVRRRGLILSGRILPSATLMTGLAVCQVSWCGSEISGGRNYFSLCI